MTALEARTAQLVHAAASTVRPRWWTAGGDVGPFTPTVVPDRVGPAPLIDAGAELATAACAVGTRHGAALAAIRLTAQAFHDPRCRALFTAATSCTLVDQDDRVYDCSLDADVDPMWTARLVEGRPVSVDVTGAYAARVLAAAGARRRAEQLLAELDDLGINVHAVELAP